MSVGAWTLLGIVLGGIVLIGIAWQWLMHHLDKQEATRQSRQLLHRSVQERRQAEWVEKVRRLPSNEYDARP